MSWLESGPLRVVLAYDVAVFVVFLVAYAFGTDGQWRHTAVGRHLMAFSVAVTLLALVALTQNLWGPAPIWVWLLGFIGLGVEGTRRVLLLFKIQFRARHRDGAEDEP